MLIYIISVFNHKSVILPVIFISLFCTDIFIKGIDKLYPILCQTFVQSIQHNAKDSAERSKGTDFRSNEPVYLACQTPHTHGSGLISLLRQSRSLVFQQSLKFPSAAEAPISLFPSFLQRASQDLFSLFCPDTLTSVSPSLLCQQMFIHTDDPFFLLFNYSLSSC